MADCASQLDAYQCWWRHKNLNSV